MKKLYEKSEIGFALVWIGLYVVAMNIGLQFAGGKDGLAEKTVGQLLVTVGIGLALAVASTVWICRNGLAGKYGLCRFRGNWKGFLFFVPLVAICLTNVVNGSSVFAREEGPFTALVGRITGQATPEKADLVSAVLLMAVAGAYALWLWKKTAAPDKA